MECGLVEGHLATFLLGRGLDGDMDLAHAGGYSAIPGYIHIGIQHTDITQDIHRTIHIIRDTRHITRTTHLILTGNSYWRCDRDELVDEDAISVLDAPISTVFILSILRYILDVRIHFKLDDISILLDAVFRVIQSIIRYLEKSIGELCEIHEPTINCLTSPSFFI